MFLMAIRLVVDFATLVSQELGSLDNYRFLVTLTQKPDSQCSGHGNKLVMLRRGLCGLLNVQTYFHIRQNNSDAPELGNSFDE